MRSGLVGWFTRDEDEERIARRTDDFLSTTPSPLPSPLFLLLVLLSAFLVMDSLLCLFNSYVTIIFFKVALTTGSLSEFLYTSSICFSTHSFSSCPSSFALFPPLLDAMAREV